MERPDNLSCDPPHKSAAENKQPFIATVSSSSSSSSSSSTKDNHEAVVRTIQQRPLRFRYPLVSLKRLKTLGPARRVLVSNSEVDNSLPKISEEENNVSPDQSYSSEKEQIEASTQCPPFADDSSPKTEEEVSTLDESNAYGDIAGGNNEPPEHRKRKADMETIGEDATISLTVNAGSIGSPNQNNADLRLDHDKHDYFGTGGLDSEGSFQKSMAEHNISVNSYSAYDEVELDFANGKIDEAAGAKFHLNQPEKLYNVSIRSDYPKPMVQDEPNKVHFATVDYSNRGDGAVFPNSSIMGMEHKQAHVVFDSHQMHLKPRSLLNLSSDGRSAPLISSVKDDSIQSKPNPALISEPKNKEKIVRRAHSVGYDFALGCIDTLKSDCNISDADVKPNLSYNTHLSSTAEADRPLDSMSSTPLVSVNSEVCEKVATDTGMENLSSHLNSLALTENQESGSLSNLGESFASHRQILNQAGASSAAKCDGLSKMVQTTKTNVTVTTAPAAAVDQILKPSINSTSGMEVNSSLTLPAFAALSCTTSAFGMSNSTSVQCTSVLSTLSSVQNLGPCKGLVSGGERGAVGESSRNSSHSDPHAGLDDSERRFNLNLYNSSAPSASIFPGTSSLFGCQSATSIRCTSGPLTSLSVGQGLNMSREQSTTAKTNSRRSLSEEPSNARLQESRMVMRSTEEILPQEPCVKERSQLPEVAGCLNQSIQQSSSQGDLEKNSAGNSRETSTSRKKYYDSDAFFRVNNKFYQKLGKIGSGGSSEVHKVISSDCTIYALKAIKLKGRDYSSAYGFCQEIDYLTRLRGKNYIIQLIDYEVTDKNLFRDVIGGNSGLKDARINEDAYIYMVLEYGEIDLAQMLLQKRKEMDAGDKQIDENWLRFYWQQILKAVNTIHEERIVHSDLKPANFLLVKGVLKLIDFGIAKAIQSDTTNIQRESQVGTLNYMSPEAFLCNDEDENGNIIKCGRPSDIWSLGCILYQMVYGKTPFAGLTSLWAKYKEITNKDHKITYGPVSNPWLLDIMKKCLVWNRNERLRIPQLLGHPFLRPPAPPSMLTQEECHHIALVEISDAYGSDGEIRSLCEKLQEQIRNLSKPSNS